MEPLDIVLKALKQLVETSERLASVDSGEPSYSDDLRAFDEAVDHAKKVIEAYT